MVSSGNLKEEIGKRIRQAREALHLTQKEFCIGTGMKLPSLKDYELGNSILGGEQLICLAKLKINANWVLTGKGDIFFGDIPYAEIESAHKVKEKVSNPYIDGDLVEIDNYVNVRGSAGPGTEVFEEAIVKVRVDARLLRERIGSNFSRIKIASVSGDSMEPTLSHGDQVLVDTSCNRFIDDAIYAIQQDGHLRFKRISLNLDGSIEVKSDSTSRIETYSADLAQNFKVVGMVIPFKFGRFKI